MVPKLRETRPRRKRKQDTGITQPRDHSIADPCTFLLSNYSLPSFMRNAALYVLNTELKPKLLPYLIDPAEEGDESSGRPLRKRPPPPLSQSDSSLALPAGSRSSGGVGGSPMADVAVDEWSRFWLSM